MIRIGFASYVNPYAWSGGGELVTRELLNGAGRSGIDIQLHAVWPKPHFGKVDVAFWLLTDVQNLPRRQRRIDQRFLSKVPRTRQWRFARVISKAIEDGFAHLDNAYVDTCDLPYLPCKGDRAYETCPFRPRTPCQRFASAHLYSDAKACYFVSPLHQEVVTTLQPVARSKARLLRPTIQPEPFLRAGHAGQQRDIENLFVGSFTEAKGSTELHEIPRLTIVTPAPPRDPPPEATVHVNVPPDQMPAYFARAKRFVFRPSWPEPFGRVVAEAALAGCDLDVEGQVGALSFSVPPSDLSLYRDAVDEFWGSILELVG